MANERDLELELMASCEAPVGSPQGAEAAALDAVVGAFLPRLGALIAKAAELIRTNPEQADVIIQLVLRVYDTVIVLVPTGLPAVFDQLLKAQIRQGLEAMLRQALA